MSDSRDNAHPTSTEAGYEVSDARVKPLVIFVVVLFLITVGVMGTSGWILERLAAGRAPEPELHPLAEPRQVPPAPRLQDVPARDIAEHRAIQDRLLGEYEWIDREQGIVRIPIERAMELVVERKGSVR